MKYITNRIKIHLLIALSAMLFLVSCNKDLEQIAGPAAVTPTGLTLGDAIAAIPNDSLYYKLILRAGPATLGLLNNKPSIFTAFVPDNNAMRNFINFLSGGATIGAPDPVYVGFINTFISAGNAASIVNYNLIPQAITTASIPNTFPNFFYPTNLNPTTGTPGFNPLVRLLTFPSTRNGNWVNNVPLTSVNAVAYNGIIHTASLMVPVPPSRVLWQRIASDPDMTYLAAAITRADSGVAPTTSASLIWVLSNFGPNLTVFAPTNVAFQNLIFGLVYQQVFAATGNAALATAIANGAVAAGPAFLSTNNVSTQTVKGIVVYQMMGSRAFTNNFPTTATSYPTLLNGGIPTHPGVALTATFTGPLVSAATVKGVGNGTAANIIINAIPFLPDPVGTSDQHFVNGTLHKITQVLLPQ